jgi:uncharacterized OB-fold protein
MSENLFRPAEVGSPTALLGSSCPRCGRAEFPRRTTCPACGADADPILLEGPAVLTVSTAVLAQPPGSRVEAPYGVGVAEFAQGIRVIGLLVGQPAIGATVDVVVHEPYPEGRTFAFRESGS